VAPVDWRTLFRKSAAGGSDGHHVVGESAIYDAGVLDQPRYIVAVPTTDRVLHGAVTATAPPSEALRSSPRGPLEQLHRIDH
jgi:hypothetical protein